MFIIVSEVQIMCKHRKNLIEWNKDNLWFQKFLSSVAWN